MNRRDEIILRKVLSELDVARIMLNGSSSKTLRTIDLLEMNGPLLREPYSKPLENGIFELRTKQGSNITRVLYFFIVGKKAVLTNGFIKKSQKTPKAEKELAKKYKADYERRYGNE